MKTWEELACEYLLHINRKTHRHKDLRFGLIVDSNGKYGVSLIFYSENGQLLYKDLLSACVDNREAAYYRALESIMSLITTIRHLKSSGIDLSMVDLLYLDYDWLCFSFSSKEEFELKMEVME